MSGCFGEASLFFKSETKPCSAMKTLVIVFTVIFRFKISINASYGVSVCFTSMRISASSFVILQVFLILLEYSKVFGCLGFFQKSVAMALCLAISATSSSGSFVCSSQCLFTR